MSYEANTGLGVSNQYGPRDSGGVKGNLPSSGYKKEFVVNLDGTGPVIKFPVVDGRAYITGYDASFVTGTVTDIDIGAVDVDAATEAAPIRIPANNTGVVVQTGGTAGDLIIHYKVNLN